MRKLFLFFVVFLLGTFAFAQQEQIVDNDTGIGWNKVYCHTIDDFVLFGIMSEEDIDYVLIAEYEKGRTEGIMNHLIACGRVWQVEDEIKLVYTGSEEDNDYTKHYGDVRWMFCQSEVDAETSEYFDSKYKITVDYYKIEIIFTRDDEGKLKYTIAWELYG